MLVETCDNLDALRTVMQLMHPTPEKIHFMPPAMPPVVEKSQHQVTDESASSHAEPVSRPQSIALDQGIKDSAGQEHAANLHGIESDSSRPPSTRHRPWPR